MLIKFVIVNLSVSNIVQAALYFIHYFVNVSVKLTFL